MFAQNEAKCDGGMAQCRVLAYHAQGLDSIPNTTKKKKIKEENSMIKVHWEKINERHKFIAILSKKNNQNQIINITN